MARKIDRAEKKGSWKMGYKRGAGPWGLLGVHDLGPIWVPFGVPVVCGPFGLIWGPFGAHLGPFGAHSILGPFGPSLLSPVWGGYCWEQHSMASKE